MKTSLKDHSKNLKSVLITGSNKGLGRALALVFADNNWTVILHGRNKKDLKKVKKKITDKGVACFVAAGDIKLKKTLDRLYNISKKQGVSVLINNAGVHCPKLPLEKIEDKHIDDLLVVNLIAPIKLTRRIYTLFLKIRRGTIININSISGLENQKLRTGYCSSKWGLRGFSETLKLETEKNNIRIIDIYPSRIKTRPEFRLGMEPQDVAKKIYQVYKNTNLGKLVLDNRPKKYK